MGKLWIISYEIEDQNGWSTVTKNFDLTIHMWPLEVIKPGIRRLRLLIEGSLSEIRRFLLELGKHPSVTDFRTLIEGEGQTELYIYVKDTGHLQIKYFDYDILFTENAPCLVRKGIEKWIILLQDPSKIKQLRSNLSTIGHVENVTVIKEIATS